MSMTAARTLPLLFALGLFAAPAHAQDEGDDSPTIVVTGRQAVGEGEALDVVRRAARPVDGQLARFQQPVCPRVIGFQDRYEEIVAARIRGTAAKVGARVGGEDCVHNLFVVIVDDSREFVDALQRREPEAFAGLSKREFTALAEEEGAARSWSSTMMTNSVGTIAGSPGGGSGGAAVNSGYGGSSISFGGNTNVMRVYESSNINPSVQQAIGAAWVVIETGAAFGKTLDQIADYAAMRGLAMVRPAELAASTDTILALFVPGAPAAPAELTAFDLAYLKGLYGIQGRRWARQQVRQLADAIVRESDRASP